MTRWSGERAFGSWTWKVERERAEWRRRCEAVLPHIGRLRAEVWTGFPIENRERAGSPFEVDDYPGGPRPRVYCPGCGGAIVYRDEVPCSECVLRAEAELRREERERSDPVRQESIRFEAEQSARRAAVRAVVEALFGWLRG